MNMQFTEKMFDYLFDQIPTLSKKINIPDKTGVIKEVDFTVPWQRVDYIEQIKKDSGIDVSLYTSYDEQILRKEIISRGFDWP
jgi:lysyl-tRNA synthetase class II